MTEYSTFPCAKCEREFRVPTSQIKWGKGKFCSQACQLQFASSRRWSRLDETFDDRFWARVKRGNSSECWLWTGVVRPCGYGRLVYKRKYISAHRYALLTKEKPPRNGMMACHACDNPLCCNPAHLWWGTASENSRDAAVKGRLGKSRKLDAREVLRLRASGLRPHEIAVHLGCSSSSVARLLRAVKASEQTP